MRVAWLILGVLMGIVCVAFLMPAVSASAGQIQVLGMLICLFGGLLIGFLWAQTDTIKRAISRFRFTLRELLLLTALVSLALGWWVDHSRLKVDRSRIEELKWEVAIERHYSRQLGKELDKLQPGEPDTDPVALAPQN